MIHRPWPNHGPGVRILPSQDALSYVKTEEIPWEELERELSVSTHELVGLNSEHVWDQYGTDRPARSCGVTVGMPSA